MVWNEIVSAVCIYLSAIIFSLSLQGKSKLTILFVQLFASFLYLANYLFVITINPAAQIGAITAGCEILRLLTFFFIEKSEKYNTKKWNIITAIIFSVALTVCTIFAWSGWFSIFPLIAAIIVSLALGNKNIKLIKIAFIIQAACIIAYLFMLNLWLNAISQIFVLIFGIIGLITYILNEKKLTKANTEQEEKTE